MIAASTDPADVRRQARRSRRRALAAALCVLGALAGLALLLARPAPHAPTAVAHPASAAATASNPTSTTGPDSVAPPAHWVTLPAATGANPDQMPTGYPRTLAGAEAFGAAVAEFAYTASFSQAEQDTALYAAPDATDPASSTQTLAEALRVWAGLAMTGALPEGDGVDGHPVAVHATPTETGVTVDVLVQVTGYDGGQTTSAITALRLDAVWTGAVSDWRYALIDPISPLPADPIGTAGFNSAGWTAISGAS